MGWRRSLSGVLAVLVLCASAPSVAVSAQALPRLQSVGPPGGVGCAMCDDATAFGRIQGIALLSDGTTVVVDRDEPMVRLLDPDGGVVAAWGRTGDGPGELRMPLDVAVTSRDGILVADAMKTRLVAFDRNGTPSRDVPLTQTAMDVRGSPEGGWIALQEARWATMSGAVILLDDQPRQHSTPLGDTRDGLTDGNGDGATAGTFSSAPGPDGRVAVSLGDEYRVRVLNPDGTPLHEIRRDIARVRRTAEEVAAIREDRERARRTRGGGHPESAGAEVEVDPLHPHLFSRDALSYDGEGRLWVRTPRGGPTKTIFDLFDSTGAFLGEVVADRALTDFFLGKETLVGVTEDRDTGIQRVMRWRLVDGTSGR